MTFFMTALAAVALVIAALIKIREAQDRAKILKRATIGCWIWCIVSRGPSKTWFFGGSVNGGAGLPARSVSEMRRDSRGAIPAPWETVGWFLA